jgi:hypothetical protein
VICTTCVMRFSGDRATRVRIYWLDMLAGRGKARRGRSSASCFSRVDALGASFRDGHVEPPASPSVSERRLSDILNERIRSTCLAGKIVVPASHRIVYVSVTSHVLRPRQIIVGTSYSTVNRRREATPAGPAESEPKGWRRDYRRCQEVPAAVVHRAWQQESSPQCPRPIGPLNSRRSGSIDRRRRQGLAKSWDSTKDHGARASTARRPCTS